MEQKRYTKPKSAIEILIQIILVLIFLVFVLYTLFF